MGESAPFWRFSAASYPDLEGAMAVDAVLRTGKRISSVESDSSSGVCNNVILSSTYGKIFCAHFQ